jgi:hypothetical protein
MGSYVFTKGATTVTITQDESAPVSVDLAKAIKNLETVGGKLFTTEVGERVDIRVIRFDMLPESIVSDLKSFYFTTINSGVDSFSFTDNSAESAIVKWTGTNTVKWVGGWTFTSEVKNFWSGTITLRKV